MGPRSPGSVPLGLTRPPRAEAAAILGRVVRSGAYSNVLLGKLGNAPDDRLVRRLVYGTLRHLLRVDNLLTAASDRRLADVQAGVLDILRIGAWELRLGEGAHHAAVNEAVAAAKSGHGGAAAGFVNAVLRKVQTLEERLPGGAAGRALELGVPVWVYEQLMAAWGTGETEQFLSASLEPAPRTALARPDAPFTAPGLAGIAGTVEVENDLTGLVLMDPSSVAVGWAVGLSSGMVVLDMAAAPGGKTLHLYDQLAGSGSLIAADRHPRRVESARHRLRSYGVHVPWVVADGLQAPFPELGFDRVLLDAPCSGLGTMRRRPEVRHRLTPDSPGRSARLQRQLLEAALRLVKSDGVVVYAVCTVFPEETTEIVDGLRAEPPSGLPGRREGNGWLLGPHLTQTDGMFISLVRP